MLNRKSICVKLNISEYTTIYSVYLITDAHLRVPVFIYKTGTLLYKENHALCVWFRKGFTVI